MSAIDFEPKPLALPTSPPTHYPGSDATAASLLLLANEYNRGAKLLVGNGRKGATASYAPFRLVAIHAIELYLSAFLLGAGETAEGIRALGHDVGRRATRAMDLGLVLRQGTNLHIQSLWNDREYLVSRYAVDLLGSMSQLNRLTASLDDVATKVSKRLEPASP